MKTTPDLSDIYSRVLLSEGKKSAELNSKKSNIVTKKQDIGKAKLVGDGPDKAKLPQKATTLKTKTTSKHMESYNTFEKLFKSAINEQDDETDLNGAPEANATMDFEVPTSDEDMADEIEDTEDEVSDLVSDLKDVVSKLNDILGKIDAETGEDYEEGSDEGTPEDEFNYEEGEDEDEEEENPKMNAESVENHGTPLVNLRSGKDLDKKNNYIVKGKIKAKKGAAHTGKFTEEPKLKKLSLSSKDLQNTKNQKVKTSNIKTGDFFR